jgi:hypothetical protein
MTPGETSIESSDVKTDLKKLKKVGRGKRELILAAAVAGVMALIAVLVLAFHGGHIRRDAAAMTVPVPHGAEPSLLRPH